ncbi:MAG: hypothetical protein ACK4F7_00725 [Inhella sp.]
MPDTPQQANASDRLAELLIELGSEVGLPLSQALDRLQLLLNQRDCPEGLVTLREPLRRARDASLLASQVGRLSSGRVKPAQSQCALHLALRQTADMRRREAQTRGLQLRLDAVDAMVISDPVLLASLLQALLDWALWHTRSSIQLQLSLTSWPAQARLQLRFALRDLDQPTSSAPPTLDGLRWMLVEHTAQALGLRLRRDDEAGICVARIDFPLWREELPLELPPHAQPESGHDTQPFAGWLAIIVSPNDEFLGQVRALMQPQGWALDTVNSVDAAFQICTEALPQAIVVDGALAGADLDQWRCHVMAEAPGFCFIEVVRRDVRQATQRPAGGLRCQLDQLPRELPALLRAALAPPGEALTFRL